MTPGVSILETVSIHLARHLARLPVLRLKAHSRLAFKILHNVKEPVVNVRLVSKLNFDLIEITQSVLGKAVSHSLCSRTHDRSTETRLSYGR